MVSYDWWILEVLVQLCQKLAYLQAVQTVS